MPIGGFPDLEWDDDNSTHFADHNITEDEVDEALSGPVIHLGRRTGAPDREYVLGRTDSGRYLVVIYQWLHEELIRPVTGWDMSAHERRRYDRQVRS